VTDDAALGLFPGQGAISSGAGAPWRSCAHWSLVGTISDIVNIDVAALLLTASNDDVVRTDNAQLATFTLSLVGWHELTERGPLPSYLAGHSLGEFSALVAAGVVSLTDGARLVAVRGAAMRRAAESNPGTMVALMGPSDDAVERVAALENVWIANENGPGQLVVSATLDGAAQLLDDPKRVGWRRATSLNVGGAFHSPLMAPAQADLDEALSTVTFHETTSFVASNVTGEWRHGGDEWRALLSRQLTSPVRYNAMIDSLSASVTTGVEMPPGSVLTGLTKRIRELDALGPLDPVAS
jgi:[acyl-carrier-protein] S-malonyltransferase